MDIIYHYPPELFNLLVDTIPLLCRSKTDTVLFFRGAGVEYKHLSDIEQRINQDKDSITKYEIVRTVISRLNEQGEITLRERREILKRVTEFETFSNCWPNDQLKAKGLVSEIRHVVNVKDSFTRMKQEHEKERSKTQLEHQRKTAELEGKKKVLEEIKRDFYSLFGIEDDKQKRGKLLEQVLNRLFKAYGILVKESFALIKEEGEGVSEQIDGVIKIDGHTYLVEMKWWQKPLGKEEISPHLVNIFSRGHAGGIIISASQYTKPAIITCKEALLHKVIVLCELEEIVMLLEKEKDLQDFFRTKIDVAIADKNPLFKPLEKA